MRMNMLAKVASRAKGFARHASLVKVPVEHGAHAAHCLKIRSSALEQGDRRTQDLCRHVPAYVAYADRGAAQMLACVMAKLREHADTQAVQTFARIEASAMPEAHKSAKKSKIRRFQATHRLKRRRRGLDAMYDVAGAMLDNANDIGQEIVRHWGPVFSAASVGPGVQADFLDFVQPQMILADWSAMARRPQRCV